MKPISNDKKVKKDGYQSDDSVRYMINTNYFNSKSTTKEKKEKEIKKEGKSKEQDDDIRYMFPTVLSKPKRPERKPKQKIKVNFWSSKQTITRLNNVNKKKNPRHTIAVTDDISLTKPKPPVLKVRKRVSFLPSPLFTDNHIPMVTVPDDLTIQLNEEEANDLREDLNLEFITGANDKLNNLSTRKSLSSVTHTSPKNLKRKRNTDDLEPPNDGNENELEFFSKYVVQKLRKMETNQRIYSENLINTVLMLGQLGKLSGKSKIGGEV